MSMFWRNLSMFFKHSDESMTKDPGVYSLTNVRTVPLEKACKSDSDRHYLVANSK